MRRNFILAAIIVLILVIGVGAYLFGAPRDSGPEKPWQAPTDSSSDDEPASDFQYTVAPVTAGSKTFSLQVADTTEKQELGLGKRKSIGGDGMIFPYSKPQRLCFWMKDMHYPIDMIWLDANKQVLKIQADASPDSYPRTTYCQEDAQYVVELDTGAAKKAGVTVGSTLSFQL